MEGKTVTIRRFELSQKVRLSHREPASGKHLSPDGLYEITRLMPQDVAGDFYYRLSSPAGERVVREDQIDEAA